MSEFVNDLTGVISSPGAAIARVMEARRWKAALLLILLVSALVTYITFPISKADQARLIRDSEMADKLSDEQLADMEKFTPIGRLFGSLVPLVVSILTLVLAAFFVYLFYKIAGAPGLYANYFSGVVHASLLDMVLGGALKGALILTKKTVMVQTGLTLFFPQLDFRSISFIALAQFDFFSIWYLAALALGIAAYAKMGVKKSMGIAFLYFLFKSVIFIGFSYLSFKMMGM